MKRYRVTLNDGTIRTVDATSYGPRREDAMSDARGNSAFTTFVIERRMREVLSVRTDTVISIEEEETRVE